MESEWGDKYLAQMMTRLKRYRADGLRLIALALVSTVLACYALGLSSVERWRLPAAYSGDAWLALSHLQVASEGDFNLFWLNSVARLGAPFEANWNDFPTYEKPIILLIGLLARIIGLFPAANVAMVLAHVTAAAAFYVVCRYLRYRWEWSFVGALLYGFAYYGFARGLGHLLLAFIYTLPFALLSCWLVAASHRLQRGKLAYRLCLVTAVFMGIGGPYYLYIYLQLICLGMVAHYFGPRRRDNLRTGFQCLGLAALGFLMANLGTFVFQFMQGRNPDAVVRHYFEAERYALRPIEFLVPPPTHHLSALGQIGDYYHENSIVQGEAFSPYLGCVAMAGLVWLGAVAFRRWVARSGKPAPALALQTAWILSYSVLGGWNALLALAGVGLFRATNRYSIVICALALVFIVSRISKISRRWPPGVNLAVALLVLGVGLYDEIPRQPDSAQAARTAAKIAADREFGGKLQQALPARAMIFQMPVMEYPEAHNLLNLESYEHFRPYFFTRTLRFSYGSNKGRLRENWQLAMERLPVQAMLPRLEACGFSAVYLNRRGFADHGAALIDYLAQLGRTNVIEDASQEQVCVLLRPAAQPRLPQPGEYLPVDYADALVRWDPAPSLILQLAPNDTAIAINNARPEPILCQVQCRVKTFNPGTVTVAYHGRVIWQKKVEPAHPENVLLRMDVGPGKNIVEFKSDASAVPLFKDLERAFAFGLANLEVTEVSAAPAGN